MFRTDVAEFQFLQKENKNNWANRVAAGLLCLPLRPRYAGHEDKRLCPGLTVLFGLNDDIKKVI
jgi:hypothetical protein